MGTGEDLRTACVREIAEETGLDAFVYDAVVDQYIAPYGAARMYVHVFAATVACAQDRVSEGGRAPSVVLNPEHDAYRWVTLHEFATLCSFPRLAEASVRAFAHYERERSTGSQPSSA